MESDPDIFNVDVDIYNDARYATNDDINKLLLSIKNGLELQLYSMYLLEENELKLRLFSISDYLLKYKSYVLNRQNISTYCLQFAAWLVSMYKYQKDENATLITAVQTLINKFDAIAYLSTENLAKFTITAAMKKEAADFFTQNPDKATTSPAIVTLVRPAVVEPWGQYSEIVINDDSKMKIRVPFGAIVSIDRITGVYRYTVPNMPTHSKVYIWPENVNHTFAFGTRLEFTPLSTTGNVNMSPITNFETLPPAIDTTASMAYFGKVVVLPLTYQSIEVPLPDKMDTTIKIYNNTTEIRAVGVASIKTPGTVTILYGETMQTMQLLNPMDLAVVSHTGEVLYISNQYMPFNEQVVPIKVNNAMQAIDSDKPAAMVNLPKPPVIPEPLPMTATNYDQLSIQVTMLMANIQHVSYAIEKKGATIYANVLYAQASEVYASVVSLLNFRPIINEILSMIDQLRADVVNLTNTTTYEWLSSKQYDDLYILVAENSAIASQGIAVAYSILVLDAVYKRNILKLWFEWNTNKKNDAMSSLRQMRESAIQELKSYDVVFSESSITPTAELIDVIVFPKINAPKPKLSSVEPADKKWWLPVVIAVPIGILLFIILVIYWDQRHQKQRLYGSSNESNA